MVLNFLSLFIVVPFLTKEPTIYGIYTVCISFSIFLTYADLGFVGAGQKYAAEHYARKELKEEIKIIGFTIFILFLFLLLLSLLFLYFSFYPETIIKSIVPGHETTVASSLFLILFLFTPVTLLQRLLQMIYGIRIEDYIVQRINIFASLIKILSVLWFFKQGQYNIVGYFLFTQLVNLVTAFIALLIARSRYKYDFKELLRSLRFNHSVFSKTKNLAFTSLYITIAWILYYELDTLVIGKFIGAEQVAIYAIGLTILSFFRSILGIMFSPFSARFNHFIGVNDLDGLKNFYFSVITVLTPLIVLPITAIAMLSKQIVLSWVGAGYQESIVITELLVLCNIFAFITYPTGMLLMVQERLKKLYFVNTLIPVIYWTGIFMFYRFLGLEAFALFKFIAFGISAIVYYIVMVKFMDVNFKKAWQSIFQPVIIPVLFILTATYFLRDSLPMEKSKYNILVVAICGGCIILFSILIQYALSKSWRFQLKAIYNSIKKSQLL